MKNLSNILLISFLFYTLNGFSQDQSFDPESQMLSPNSNYYNILSNGESYFELNPTESEEGSGYHKFTKWAEFWRSRVDNIEGSSMGDFEPYINYMTYIMSIDPICTGNDPSNWTFVGRDQNTSSIQDLGIIVSICPDPNNQNIVYLGTNKSGIWKTSNFLSTSPTWTNITNQTRLAGLGINSIAVDINNPLIIYAATGLGSFYGGAYGVGIIKTIDGGLTWTLKNPLTFNNRLIAYKVIIDPSNTNIIYALISEDVYKSTDGGNNWTSVFTLPNSIGQDPINPNGPARYLRDIEFHPTNSNIIYISSDDAENAIWGGFNTGALAYVSINAGSSWNTMNINPGGTFSSNVQLAVTPAEPNSVFVSYQDYSPGGHTRIKKSVNQGSTWVDIGSSNLQISQLGTWKNDIAISSTNSQLILLGALGLNVSTNGGATFTSAPVSHVDIRTIVSSATNGNSFYIGDDGGIDYTSDAGSSVEKKNGSGLTISQYYGIGISNKDQTVAGGMQDNDVSYYKNGNWWLDVYQDGSDVVIDNNNSNIAYVQKFCCCTTCFPLIKLTFNGTSWVASSYIEPTITSEHAKRAMFMHPNNNLYVGYHDIFSSSTPNISWSQLSSFSQYGVSDPIQDFDVSHSNPLTMYNIFSGPCWGCHNASGYFFKSTNGGGLGLTDWIDMTASLPQFITDYFPLDKIVIDPNNENKLWIGIGSLYGNSNPGPYNGALRVIKSIDGGSSWVDYSNNLPQLPINDLVYEEGTNDGMYAATDIGVFYTNGDIYPTQGWTCFSESLPTSIISDLEIDSCSHQLYAATFGRGIWVSNLYPYTKLLTTSYSISTPSRLNTDLIIPSGLSLNISAPLSIAKGRKITVQSGGSLNITSGAHLFNGCGEMWDGIYAESGSTINISSSTIEDAYQAVNLVDGVTYSIVDNTFDVNFIGVKFGNTSTRHNIIGDLFDNHFQCSANLPPYFGTPITGVTPDTKALCGIYAENVDYLYLGKVGSQSNANTFQDLECGIYADQTNLTVANSKFSEIYNHYYYNVVYGGDGIFTNGHGSYNFTMTDGIGNGQPDFYHCLQGIDVRAQDFTIENLNMNEVENGIKIVNCRGVTSYIHQNVLNCKHTGINLYQNDQAKFILVNYNDITITGDQQTLELGYYGIGIFEQHMSDKDPHINLLNNNIILEYARDGILVLSSDHLVANANYIELTPSNQSPIYVYGIEVNDCDGSSFYLNTIRGFDTSPSSTQIGVETNINSGAATYYACNDVKNTLRDFDFGGGAMATQLWGNTMGDAYEGLHITDNCFIGVQYHSGNCFDGSFGNPLGAAINLNTNQTYVTYSQFYVNDQNGICYLPTNNWPLNAWFFPDYHDDEFRCDQIGCNPCDEEILLSLDLAISQNQVGSDNYNTETIWEGRKHLMEKLNKYPDLLNSNTLFQSFYNNFEHTTLNDLIHIGFGSLDLNQMTELEALQYASNDSIIDTLNSHVKALYEQFSNTTDEPTRNNLASQISNLNGNVSALEHANELILEAFNDQKEVNSDVLNQSNNAISTGIIIEENIKQVYDVYLRTLAKDNMDISASDDAVLLNIAMQCPYEGGPGVYRARSIYSQIHPSIVFDDKFTCGQLGYYRTKPKFESNEIFGGVVPNPSNDVAKLLYSIQSESNCKLEVFNIVGKTIYSNNIDPQNNSVEFTTANWNDGIYSYVISSDDGILLTGKFNVLH